MKFTPLYECHVRDAMSVINLKGVARAMEYRGHAEEHHATRTGVTLCDVSHMGEFEFKGPDALNLVQKLITNDASKLAVNQALYSAMCSESGGVIDDLVCFRLGPDHFRWVVNVTKIDEDFHWVLRHARGLDVKVDNISTDTALMALQGPHSREVLQRITKADLSTVPYYWFEQTMVQTSKAAVPCLISRTGYTGEHGYEIMVERDLAPWVWDELLMVGRPLGIIPSGVAARESLRTEAGYLLNGNDMDAQTNPFEAGLGWIVKFSKEFVGKDALARIKAEGVNRTMVGLEVHGNHSIRNGQKIFANGKEVGRVTSGPLSPSLTGRSLGLGYVSAQSASAGSEIEFEIRGTRCKGQVVALPFCERKAKSDPAFKTHSPYGLRYSRDHSWIFVANPNERVVTIGLTDFGQRTLGDVLSVHLPQVGQTVTKGSVAVWMESYRKSFGFDMPVSGEVVEINESLPETPRHINAYPYGVAGLLKVRVQSLREVEELMRFDAYVELTGQLARYDAWSKDLRVI